MTLILYAEQAINGIQLGVMLFLVSAGLTLVFGIMNFINLAHGSLYMIGAFSAAVSLRLTDSFLLAVFGGIAGSAIAGIAVEWFAARRLYARDHLDQVLGTFGLLLFFNEAARLVWGDSPLYLRTPDALSGFVRLIPGGTYPAYRLAILGVGLAVAVALFLIVSRTRLGTLIRAGASNRQMVSALGIDVTRLFAFVFVLGSGLAGFAGVMMGPILSVEVGMGEPMLILAFVVIVIGGLGSIRGALVGALIVGLVDSFGRFLLPQVFGFTVGPALSSMSIYLLMAVMLAFRPEGLFPAPQAASGAAAPGSSAPVRVEQLPGLAIAIVTGLMLLVPLLDEPYYTRLLTRIMIFGLAALSLDLIFGYGGMVSFGHAAFLGIGSYTVGILAFHGIDSAVIAWPVTVLTSIVAGALIGAISLRTGGMFFIMITLAFAQMLYFLGVGLEAYGGDDGLPLRRHTQVGGILDLSDPATLFYVALAALVAALAACRRLVSSEFGLVLQGIRDNERRMRALGYATYRHRLISFALAGGLCGFAGALLINVDSYVGPSTMHWFVSGELMVMLILGGAATLVGPVLGAAAYLLLEEGLSSVTEHWLVIFGPLLLLVVLFARGGLYGWWLGRPRHDR